ncbi:metallophosphoesterase family protein [Phenylobacterium sp.]|uniref:metallophosphoesterase family protein n=1 Tax=Phenylobacterium sp. TaxID=1871053 RepID=UPI002C626A9C|nr:metallophosphoesterase family protein [Phenylobacterium sp.]HVI32519.1 metallophosphoesterase family protein [Phenylobacterium sp.]
MLQRVDTETLRAAARRDLAAVLEGVEAQIAQALSRWPEASAGDRGAAIARFGAGAGGKLVQVPGRAPKRSWTGAAAGRSEGRRIYAVGDVHGCYDLLIGLLARLGEDAADGPAPTLILLGDYVDRGPDSARVLEALCLLKARAPFGVCMLKGNHEEALLTFLDAPADGAPWIAFGGAATLLSYGVEPPTPASPSQAYVAARDELLRRMPASHLRLLQTLDLMALVGDYAFVHAGVAPGEPLRRQSARDLLWIRREFLEARGPFEKVIVHGHTWEDDRPVVTPARIGLDTGAYETGVLGAMRFEDASRAWLQVRDPERPRWLRPGAPRPWTPVAEPLDFTRAG